MREPSFPPPPPPPRPPSLLSAHTPNEATFLRVDFSQKQTQKEEEEEGQSFAPLRRGIVAQWRLNFAWASGFFCAKSSCVLDRERCHLIKMGGVGLVEHQSPEEIIAIGQDHPHPSRRRRKRRRLKRIEKLRINIRGCEGGGWQDPVFLCEFGKYTRKDKMRSLVSLQAFCRIASLETEKEKMLYLPLKSG